jgi:hypothetical protein
MRPGAARPGRVRIVRASIRDGQARNGATRGDPPERLVHRRRATLRLLLPDRLDLEQSIPITHTEIIPRE